MASASSLEMTPQEVVTLQQAGEKLFFVDVREANEWALTRIEGAELVPMNTIPANMQALESKSDEGNLIVYCHHGTRSLQVVAWLREQGVAGCYSMAGGIDRWSQEVDHSVARY